MTNKSRNNGEKEYSREGMKLKWSTNPLNKQKLSRWELDEIMLTNEEEEDD